MFTWLCFMTDACPPGPPLWVQPLASRNPRAFCCPGSQRTRPPASNPGTAFHRHFLSKGPWATPHPGAGPSPLQGGAREVCAAPHLNSAPSLKLSPRAGYSLGAQN